ncbi:MAG: hypothetical protein P4L76_10360 [Beijerinckiaceae bacterium]|nr:hypothetical protein [Beijerinckiaceae bacterium]
MRLRLSRLLAASSLVLLSAALVCGASESGFAQPKPAAPAAAPADDNAPLEQVALTEKQILGLLAAQKDIGAITAKLPEGQDAPNPKVQAQLDAIAKKNGFTGFDEFDKIAGNVNLVLAGFDPETKTYVGPEAVIKKQIAEVTGDKQISAKEKKETLDGLNASLKEVMAVKFPDNIKLVGKYYDKLSEALQQD